MKKYIIANKKALKEIKQKIINGMGNIKIRRTLA
jgi:hypothetical protein